MEDAVAEVSLEMDTVHKGAATLDILEGHLERLVDLVRGVREEQGDARWTAIPACQEFARIYAGSLAELEGHLRRLRVEVVELRRDLQGSARALLRSDEEARALMETVNARFGGTPTSPDAPAGPSSPFAPPTASTPTDGPSPFAPGA